METQVRKTVKRSLEIYKATGYGQTPLPRRVGTLRVGALRVGALSLKRVGL